MPKKTNKTKSSTNKTKSSINHFLEMKKVALELDKKWNLSYASWADVWDTIRQYYPHTKKIRHENQNWTLGFVDDFWAFAKVTVSIEPEFWEITTYLPVQDNNNQPIKKESYKFLAPKNEYKNKANIPADAEDIREAQWKYWKYRKYKSRQNVDALDSNRINKAYQRATVKAIAELTGLGLYVYKWEDLPTDDTKVEEKKSDVINKALEAVGNPQTPVETKPETKQDEKENNSDADKIRYEEWEKYMTDAVLSLVEKKWADTVTVDDLKNIGIDLQNKWNCNNTDKVYISLRDKILMPLINDLNSKK